MQTNNDTHVACFYFYCSKVASDQPDPDPEPKPQPQPSTTTTNGKKPETKVDLRPITQETNPASKAQGCILLA
jgi:hypothetical protein